MGTEGDDASKYSFHITDIDEMALGTTLYLDTDDNDYKSWMTLDLKRTFPGDSPDFTVKFRIPLIESPNYSMARFDIYDQNENRLRYVHSYKTSGKYLSGFY